MTELSTKNFDALHEKQKDIVSLHVANLKLIRAVDPENAGQVNDAREVAASRDGVAILEQRHAIDEFIRTKEKLLGRKVLPSLRKGATEDDTLIATHRANISRLDSEPLRDESHAFSEDGLAVLHQLTAIDKHLTNLAKRQEDFRIREEIRSLKTKRLASNPVTQQTAIER